MHKVRKICWKKGERLQMQVYSRSCDRQDSTNALYLCKCRLLFRLMEYQLVPQKTSMVWQEHTPKIEQICNSVIAENTQVSINEWPECGRSWLFKMQFLFVGMIIALTILWAFSVCLADWEILCVDTRVNRKRSSAIRLCWAVFQTQNSLYTQSPVWNVPFGEQYRATVKAVIF